jgi:hypothetical protein
MNLRGTYLVPLQRHDPDGVLRPVGFGMVDAQSARVKSKSLCTYESEDAPTTNCWLVTSSEVNAWRAAHSRR